MTAKINTTEGRYSKCTNKSDSMITKCVGEINAYAFRFNTDNI